MPSDFTLIPGFNPGPYTGAGNNTYVVRDRRSGESLLIDAATGDSRHLEALAEATGLAGPSRIVVTHAHTDHIEGVPALRSRWPASQFAKMPWPDRDAKYDVVWSPLADDDVLNVGDDSLRVIHTPGHAPDHVCLYRERDGVLFCGDLLVADGTVLIPGSWGGSLRQYLASLARVRQLGPSRVFPAHGVEITDVVALIDHYVEHRRQRDDQVLAAVDSGATTPTEIVDRVYPELGAALRPGAEETVLAHLVKLEDEGRVRRQIDDDEDGPDRWERG